MKCKDWIWLAWKRWRCVLPLILPYTKGLQLLLNSPVPGRKQCIILHIVVASHSPVAASSYILTDEKSPCCNCYPNCRSTYRCNSFTLYLPLLPLGISSRTATPLICCAIYWANSSELIVFLRALDCLRLNSPLCCSNHVHITKFITDALPCPRFWPQLPNYITFIKRSRTPITPHAPDSDKKPPSSAPGIRVPFRVTLPSLCRIKGSQQGNR